MVPPNKGVTYNLHAMKIDGVDVGDYSAVIPAVAEAKNIPCVDILGLCEKEGWSF